MIEADGPGSSSPSVGATLSFFHVQTYAWYWLVISNSETIKINFKIDLRPCGGNNTLKITTIAIRMIVGCNNLFAYLLLLPTNDPTGI